jgi:hypothetical protein
MEYLLARYEDNGYHDSYFHAVTWDSDLKVMREHTEGATAYGGWFPVDAPKMNAAPADIRAEFRAFACHAAAMQIFNADLFDCTEPQSVKVGDNLRLLRDVNGKANVKAGDVGRVFWSGAYGHFYRNGYNKPNRSNIRAGLEMDGGQRRVFVALSACRRTRSPEPIEDTETRLMASYDEKRFSIQPLTACRAWFSEVYIYDVEPKQGGAKP